MKNFIFIMIALLMFNLGAIFMRYIYYPLVLEDSEPKQSNIVVLGEGGSMRLAKPGDLDSNDVKLGMIIDSDEEGSIYYEEPDTINVDTILYKMIEDSIMILKSGFYRIQFTSANNGRMRVVSYMSDSTYTTRKSKVSNINTSDLYKD
jgi:hypothetical protein